MIQEYRKASAGKLGLEWTLHPTTKQVCININKVKDDSPLWKLWQPDKDANQREMIEDWLIEQKCSIGTNYHRGTKDWLAWIELYEAYDKSKSTAFMKAFMEYIKQK